MTQLVHRDEFPKQGAVEIMVPRERFYFKEWRKYRRLTQEQLAERISSASSDEISISAGYLSQIETRKLWPSAARLQAIADALDCSIKDLLGHNPFESSPILSVWRAIPEERRNHALTVLRTFADPEPSSPKNKIQN
ncbi:helix-turn-helix domain-containing protein [Elstera litoralis]|nr:helix-turn-helix transcriptional regulator [Elstera litoralis]